MAATTPQIGQQKEREVQSKIIEDRENIQYIAKCKSNEAKFRKKAYCCCQTKSWCIFIGWINAIFSLLNIVFALTGQTTMIAYFESLIDILLGFILVIGVYTKTTILLWIWLTGNAIGLGILIAVVVALLLTFFNPVGSGIAPPLFMILIIIIFVQCFCIHVVNKYRKELQGEIHLSNQRVKFNPISHNGGYSV